MNINLHDRGTLNVTEIQTGKQSDNQYQAVLLQGLDFSLQATFTKKNEN